MAFVAGAASAAGVLVLYQRAARRRARRQAALDSLFVLGQAQAVDEGDDDDIPPAFQVHRQHAQQCKRTLTLSV